MNPNETEIEEVLVFPNWITQKLMPFQWLQLTVIGS